MVCIPLLCDLSRYRRFSRSGLIDETEYRFRIAVYRPLGDFVENVLASTLEAAGVLIALSTIDIWKTIQSYRIS